jgi:glycerol-3-phosphate acyltransferase PlsY
MHLGSPGAEILAGLLAFLIGGVPFGWLYARIFRGVDLRTVGSGNVGATNASRLHRGRTAAVVFVTVFALDCAKGFAAAFCSPALGTWLGGTASDATMSVVCGSCAILGHLFSPYLSFRGGKGVATALGVVTALATWPAIYAVGAWGLLVLVTRYVSLGSVVAMTSIPVTYLLRNGADTFHGRIGIFAFLTACAGLVIWRHRENIARLLAGREQKIGTPSRSSAAR